MKTKENKQTHTPGPWTQRGMGIYSDEAMTSLDAHIADVYHSGPTKEQDMANARLIAAAPDLLSLVKSIDAALFKQHQRLGLTEAQTVLMHRCRAAIAKATGNQTEEK